MMKDFVKRLTKLREARGISLNELSVAIHVNYQILENWECGRDWIMNTHTIVKLAKYFGVSTDYLLGL